MRLAFNFVLLPVKVYVCVVYFYSIDICCAAAIMHLYLCLKIWFILADFDF